MPHTDEETLQRICEEVEREYNVAIISSGIALAATKAVARRYAGMVGAGATNPTHWKPDETWNDWCVLAPHRSERQHKLVLVMHETWDEPRIERPSDVASQMNVFGLYWKPCEGDFTDPDHAAPTPAPPTA